MTCLLRKRRFDAGGKRLDPRVEEIIKKAIVTDYLTDLKKSPTAVTRVIETRCKNKGLPAPSKVAVMARIEEILPEEQAAKREGRNAALDFRSIRGSMPGADTLNAVWQIDHTPADVILVDEQDRIPIGKPWITLVIDVFSRMVVGWYISFDPPGALATGLCISNAILPKDGMLGRLGVDFPWICQSKPAVIQADNAKEFHGEMLQEAAQEHGFNMKFRKLKKPNYGAHIERLFGTFAERIHELDGTTFSNTAQKGEYKSEKNATMTLVEFERWFANLILGEYHHKKHSALGVSPIQRYEEGLYGSDDVPGLGVIRMASNPDKLRIDFMPLLRRTIQTYGVVSDFIFYHDPVLDKWIGAPEPGNKRKAREFIFRYDPRDISYLFFWDPQLREYFRIPYRNTAYPRISTWELKAIKSFLKDRGISPVVPTICDRGQRLLPLETPLASCYRCGWDLREPLADDLVADAESLVFQGWILDALSQGQSVHLPGGSCFSLLLFQGLKRLLQLLGGEGRFKRVRELMLLEGGLLNLPLQASAHFCLETLRVGDRALMLSLLRLLLEDWPDRFMHACRIARVSSSYLVNYRGGLPYWLYRPIRDQLFDKPYSPSPLERQEARQYLVRNGEPANASAVRRLLGMWTASDTWKLEHPPWNRRRPL